MSAKDNGGPSFPAPDLGEQDFFQMGAYSGMTLRDYFAAKAMQGMLACPIQPQSGADMFARDAYKIADSMLKAR